MKRRLFLTGLTTYGFISSARAMEPRIYGSGGIQVQEWMSLNCPYCADFFLNNYQRIQSQLINSGRITYEFCDFPLNHMALIAAVISRMLPYDAYLPFIARLYANSGWQYSLDSLRQLSKMDADQFNQIVNDTGLQSEIADGAQDARNRLGINKTPTFFFDGKKVEGAIPYDLFVKKLDRIYSE